MTSPDTADVKTTGRRIMNELMGDGYVEKKDQGRNSFNDVIQDYSEEVCFGRVWAREGIDRKTRSIINLSVLTALGRPAQLAHHVEGDQQRRDRRRDQGSPPADRRLLRAARGRRGLQGRRRRAAGRRPSRLSALPI